MKDLVDAGIVERRIYLIRGERVMLDAHLAALYGVTTGNLNKAVNRNLERFPRDFMFRLSIEEHRNLRFHFGSLRWGEHSKYPPRAFTELGVSMLSSVLRSPRAVAVNITIMRVFQKLRRMLAEHKELAAQVAKHERRLDKCEHRVDGHDQDITALMETVPKIPPPEPAPAPKAIVGFALPPKRKRRAKRTKRIPPRSKS